jgi:hypothetical protein
MMSKLQKVVKEQPLMTRVLITESFRGTASTLTRIPIPYIPADGSETAVTVAASKFVSLSS